MTVPHTLSELQWELSLNAITAASASFAGAYGAWKIASRTEKRKSVADEIAACNIAVGLCSSIMTVMVAVRGQLLLPKILGYQDRFQKYAVVAEAAWLGRPYEQLEMGMDIRTISVPFFPINELQSAVTGIRGSKQAPILLAALRQSLESLKASIERHNDLTRALREKERDTENLYFGLFDGNGADESFPDAMRGLDVQSLDCLYYPELLGAVITHHAIELSKKYSRGKWMVSRLTPVSEKYKPIMPDLKDYAESERIFRPKIPKPAMHPPEWFNAHYEGYFQRALRSAGWLT